MPEGEPHLYPSESKAPIYYITAIYGEQHHVSRSISLPRCIIVPLPQELQIIPVLAKMEIYVSNDINLFECTTDRKADIHTCLRRQDVNLEIANILYPRLEKNEFSKHVLDNAKEKTMKK